MIGIGIAGLIGLVGGILLGIIDSIAVMHSYAPRPFPLSAILPFSLYSVGVYGFIGCLGMVTFGVIATICTYLGGHTISRTRWAAVHVGIFTILSSSLSLSYTMGEIA